MYSLEVIRFGHSALIELDKKHAGKVEDRKLFYLFNGERTMVNLSLQLLELSLLFSVGW